MNEQGSSRKRTFILIFVAIAIISLVLAGFVTFTDWTREEVVEPEIPDTRVDPPEELQTEDSVQAVATGLEIPWGVVFLPDNSMLITQRPGVVAHVRDGLEQEFLLEEVHHVGEGGLLGIALHPDFETNEWVYLYRTVRRGVLGIENELVRYRFTGEALEDEQIILGGIPGARFHNGGRIAFGPDGYLYVTTGDAEDPSLAQDTDSLAGKILRITAEGQPAPDNPFANEVYSFGHRNPQGLAWDDEGNVWATEHGSSAHDELNRIEAGNNYGWPEIEGDEVQEGMETPIMHSGADETWAPAGLAYWNGSLIFGGLRGSTLYEVDLNGTEMTRHFVEDFGRIRAVTVGPDDALYVTTSNRDGRGTVRTGDDRVIRIPSL